MDQPKPTVERTMEGRLPWWVRLAFPLGMGPRRYVLRNFWFFLIGAFALGGLFGVQAFLLSEEWHPYRWWLVAYLAVVGLVAAVEGQAIRWMDRSKRWPR